MNNLYNKLDMLCSTNKITISKMCSMAKVSRGAITDLKMGRTKSLSLKTLTKIADYFGVTIDYLTGSKNLEQKEKPAQTQAKNQELDPAFFRVSPHLVHSM